MLDQKKCYAFNQYLDITFHEDNLHGRCYKVCHADSLEDAKHTELVESNRCCVERGCAVDVVVDESSSDVEDTPQQHTAQKQLPARLAPKQGVV